jgi:hypothetical protein
MLDYPAYHAMERIENINGLDYLAKYSYFLIRSFTSVRAKFEFPKNTQFPNLPVRVENSSIYPLKGEGYFTGLEIYFAIKSLNCKVFIFESVFIPFTSILKKYKYKSICDIEKNKNDKDFPSKMKNLQAAKNEQSVDSVPYVKFDNSFDLCKTKFFNIFRELLLERSKYPKKSYLNDYYKFLLNSGIGNMGRGLSDKTIYDPKTRSNTTSPMGALTNPLYAG